MTRAPLMLFALGMMGCATTPCPETRSPDGARVETSALVRMAPLEERLRAAVGEDADPASPDEDGFLATREAHTFARTLSAGCHTFTVVAGIGLLDVDLAAYRPEGATLAADTQPDPHPTVQLCVEAPARVWLHVAAYEGAGAFVVRHVAHPRRQLEAIAQAIGGRPGRYLDGVVEDAPVRRGFTREVGRQTVALEDGPVAIPVTLRAGRCVHLRAQHEGDAHVGLELRVGTGALRADPSATPELQHCAAADTRATLTLSAGAPARVVFVVWEGSAERIGGDAALWARPASADSGERLRR